MKKKFLCILSIIMVLILVAPLCAFAAPQTVSNSVILIDADTGRVLYEKNADEKMYPASTTKVMTAILCIENLTLTDVVTASATGASIPDGSSTINISAGEQMTVEEMLYAMMLGSANETCNILGEEVSGSISAFVEKMNAKAKELGMTSTNYVNPHGFHDENHYTTARDMATIAQYAMQNETFRKIVSTKSYYIDPTNKYPEKRYLNNTNELLNGRYVYSAVTGIKTGYTTPAGNCLVSSATKGDENLIAVTLGAEPQVDGIYSFIDSREILKFGFDNFSKKTLCAKDEILSEADVKHGRGTDFVTAMAERNLSVLLPNDVTVSELTTEIKLEEKLRAPIAKGTIIGSVTYFYKDENLGTVNLVAGTDVKTDYFSLIFGSIFSFLLHPLVLIPLLLLGGGFIVLVLISQAKAKKRRRYLKKKRYNTSNNSRKHR